MNVNPIPAGYPAVTPYFLVKDANRYIHFLEDAFDGELLAKHDSPEGNVVNAKVKVGNSMVMLGEPPQGHEHTAVMTYLYVYLGSNQNVSAYKSYCDLAGCLHTFGLGTHVMATNDHVRSVRHFAF